MSFIDKISASGIKLPEAKSPIANYLPVKVVGGVAYVSGQLPVMNDGSIPAGKVGSNFTIEEGYSFAKQCIMNMFAQLKLFCENESYDVISCIKLGVFINAIDGFDSHANVANGASDFIVEILGNSSKHTRFAIGAGSLPRNTPIEIDGIFEVKRL